jgi:transcriptional regulator with XRE-family HTH domain
MAKTKVAKMGRPPNPIDPNGSFAEHYGWKIRNLREERGWSLEEAAAKLACSPSHLSRLERALKAPDRPTARLLDTTFGTTYFTEHWQLSLRERIPPAARSLADNEAEATVIMGYQPMLIFGLLQVEGYVRALACAGTTPDLADEIVAERLRRQTILERGRPPRLLIVLDEAAIRRPVGGPEVMREQLDRLRQLAARPNITIQVVPASTAAYAGLSAGFTLMCFEEGPDVAYQDGVGGTGRIVRDLEIVSRLTLAYDLIRTDALPADATVRLIKEVQETL